MGTNNLYFYGVTHSDYHSEQFIKLKEMGLDLVQYEKIFAIVSEKPYENLMHTTKEILAQILVEHQRVLEQLMEIGFSKLIPVKLGTWLKNKKEIRKILGKGYQLCIDIMEETNSRIEVDLVVTWADFNQVIQMIADTEIVELKKMLLEKGNNVSIADKIQIGKLMKDKLDEKAQDTREKLIEEIVPLCEKLKRHEDMNDQMVANIAFLIHKNKLSLFEETLNQLDKKWNGELNFKFIGPLPCYSFYTLEVIELRFDQINQARNILGLPEKASGKEIRQAYTTKIKSFHPDVYPQKMNGFHFEELTKAYHTISNYQQIVRQSSDDDLFLFTEEQVNENSVLVKIKE